MWSSHAPRERVSWNDVVCHVACQSVVTLHVSVWVEIESYRNAIYATQSRSTWACELKLYTVEIDPETIGSRSTWACELKSALFTASHIALQVTLHVSVWVEIFSLQIHSYCRTSRSTWACELKSRWSASATASMESRSTWACELKWTWSHRLCYAVCVTLHVSVWVEIDVPLVLRPWDLSRSTWACELKFAFVGFYKFCHRSRSTWACELKLNSLISPYCVPRSRSTWACELKFSVILLLSLQMVTLHVSVWVEILNVALSDNVRSVTLHVSVWVEIELHFLCMTPPIVTLHVSVWVEIRSTPRFSHIYMSRSTWACELKLAW